MGIVVDSDKPDYVQGDFLVRGGVGADPEDGELAVGTEVRPAKSCGSTRATAARQIATCARR